MTQQQVLDMFELILRRAMAKTDNKPTVEALENILKEIAIYTKERNDVVLPNAHN